MASSNKREAAPRKTVAKVSKKSKRKKSKRRKGAVRQRKISYVLREFKQGKLKDRWDNVVTNRKQAIAIAISEAERSSGYGASKRFSTPEYKAYVSYVKSKNKR